MKQLPDKLGIGLAALGIVAAGYGVAHWALPLYACWGQFLDTAGQQCAQLAACDHASSDIVVGDDGAISVRGLFYMRATKRSTKNLVAIPESVEAALRTTAETGHPLLAKYRRNATVKVEYVR